MDFTAVLDVLFPPECLACGMALPEGTICPQCRRNAVRGVPPIAIENVGDGPACYFLAAAGRYGNPALRALICALKFEGITAAAIPLAEFLAYRAAALPLPLGTFRVMPIPLSRQRLRERGFNQSSLIAARLAALLGLPFEDRTLIRIGHRSPQSAASSRAAREENLRGCFALEAARAPDLGLWKNVILVDDVSTSGSTFREGVRTLMRGGAEHILALAAAKA